VSFRGSGPGQYSKAPQSILAIGGDSTLIPDEGLKRWLILNGTSVVATVPAERMGFGATSPLAGIQADRRGFLVKKVVAAFDSAAAAAGIPDSALVLRTTRAGGKVDTLTRLRRIPVRVETTTDTVTGQTVTDTVPVSFPWFVSSESSILCADGWLAVVRVDPYRVDWRSPDGKWIRGDPLPFPDIEADDDEKRFLLGRVSRSTGVAWMLLLTRIRDMGGWPASFPPVDLDHWPLLATADGRVVVRHNESSMSPQPRYDVINRKGKLEGQILLRWNERILGFGAKSVYILETGNDEAQVIRRHAWNWPPKKPAGQ
jgi:hypothetical protein